MTLFFGILSSKGHGAQTYFADANIGMWNASIFHVVKNRKPQK